MKKEAQKSGNKDTGNRYFFLTRHNKSVREGRKRQKPSAHIEVCFLRVCVCVCVSGSKACLGALMRDQSSLRLHLLNHCSVPPCSPPALLSLLITIWAILCRLLSLSPSPCCPFFLFLICASCDLSRVGISFHTSTALKQHMVHEPVFPMFSYSSLFPVQPTSPCHIALLTYDSQFLHAIQLIHSFWFTI